TLQSSSPSYLLMASLDAARAQAAQGGALDEAVAAAQLIRSAVSRCQHLELLDTASASAASVLCFDPLRLTLLVDRLGLAGGGFQAAEWLEQRHGVVPELATAKTVVLALGPGTLLEHARVAAAALQDLDRDAHQAAAELNSGAGTGGDGGLATPPFRDAACEFSGSGSVGRAADVAEAACVQPPPCSPAPDYTVAEVALTPREAYFARTERWAIA
ncbi:Arginine decarboxylase, partial [Tetrabaena socialis]